MILQMEDKEIFEKYESEVRSYCRIFDEELDYFPLSFLLVLSHCKASTEFTKRKLN